MKKIAVISSAMECAASASLPISIVLDQLASLSAGGESPAPATKVRHVTTRGRAMGPDEDREIHHTERVYELLLDPLGQRRFVPDPAELDRRLEPLRVGIRAHRQRWAAQLEKSEQRRRYSGHATACTS